MMSTKHRETRSLRSYIARRAPEFGYSLPDLEVTGDGVPVAHATLPWLKLKALVTE